AGQAYGPKDFASEVWAQIERLSNPSDGFPATRVRSRAVQGGRGTMAVAASPVMAAQPAPCPLGFGTRGGTSRGPNSGSRLRLYMCECSEPPNKARVASDDFRAHCDTCRAAFVLVVAVERHSRKL